MNVAIIPARGGSKRIPGKNVKDFCGRPIISYSISAAVESGCFDKIIISTDDEDIAEVALQYGAEVPFFRPHELANDHAATLPVIKHAIEWLAKNGWAFTHACCIYATAPLIDYKDIIRGYELMLASSADYAFTVVPFPSPIQRALYITENGRVNMFHPEHYYTRSQDLTPAYHDAAQFYWGKTSAYMAEEMIFSDKAIPIIMPAYRVQDIDNAEDWVAAEMKYRMLQSMKD